MIPSITTQAHGVAWQKLVWQAGVLLLLTCPIHAQALLHHWELNGDATDSAGSAHGTEIGGLTYTAGRFGQAVHLDGIDDHIATSAGTIVPATDYTVMAWVLWDGESAHGSRGYIAGAQNSGTAGEVFTMGRSADGTDRKLFLNLLVNGGQGNSITESADGTISAGTWQHVAYTVDSSKGTTIYLNGTVVGTNTTRTTHNPATTLFHIGSNPNTGAPNHFDGLIDDVAIFQGVLDTTELNNARNDGAANFNHDQAAPVVTGFTPGAGETGVYPGTHLVATFDEDIVLKPGGTITIRNLNDPSGASDRAITLPDARVSVSGRDLIVDPDPMLAFGTNFAIRVSPDAIGDDATNSNPFPGVADDGTWFFRTVDQDLTPPFITLTTPNDNATDVLRNTSIVATFDEDILAGAGDIVLRDLLDGSTTRTIAVTDSAQVTIVGRVLTIDPAGLLAADRSYAMQIASTAVRNYSEVPFAGIPESDETTWNFRTQSASPNVIFILGDDQAWYDYSFMQRREVEKTAINMNRSISQVAHTPAIDRLADEGLTFTRGYATPICRPSLASIITGAFPHQTLITGNDLVGRAPDQEVEARMQVLHPLPRTLAAELGYTSFQTGKWWEGHFSNGGFTHGDTVNSTAGGTAPSQWNAGKPGYVTARHGDWGLMAGRVDYVNDAAAPAHPIPYSNTVETVTDFIDAQMTAGTPFFLWYAPFLPHTPHDPPDGLISKYDALINEPNESGNFFAKYYANIERFDGGVGAILDHLDAQGIANDTIVVMICDNGWINQTNASAYAARSKQSPYEGGIRTPIIVRWPDRIKAGGSIEPQIITTPVSLVDLVPTIHDALDLPTSPEMTGLSLLDLSAVSARRTVFSEDSMHDIQDLHDPSRSLEARVAIRDGWKLILFANGNSELYHLYDTTTGAPLDPHETTDLSARHPELAGELTTAIVNWYAVAPNDFDSWISDPAFGIAPADRDFSADPDGDKLANGLEAWLGSHPGQSNAGLRHVGGDGTTFTLKHPRNPNPPAELSAAYRWSKDLVTFHAGGAADGDGTRVDFSAQPDAPSPGLTTVTAAVSGTATGKLFIVLEVSQD
jgi:uncharacterized sulfatase